MKSKLVSRRVVLQSTAAAAAWISAAPALSGRAPWKPKLAGRLFVLQSTAAAAAWISAAPALIGRAEAATVKLKLSSSQANDPKFANARVYYDTLINNLKAKA